MILASSSAFADDMTATDGRLSPQSLDLSPLRNLNTLDNPMGADYSYHEAFKVRYRAA